MTRQPIKYPVSPRLSPDAHEYICDECGRRWIPGQSSGCKECIAAIEHGLYTFQPKQAQRNAGIKIYWRPITIFVAVVILAAIVLPLLQ